MLSLLGAVATASNRAVPPRDAMEVALARICETFDWPLGHALVSDTENGVWSEPDCWFLADERFLPFKRATQEMRLELDAGLPGRVRAGGRAFWAPDLSKLSVYARKEPGDAVGLRSAMGFPVKVRDEIVAVLEFFSDELTRPDELVLQVMDHVGEILGRVFERVRAEETDVAHRQRLERNLRQAQKMEAVGRLAGGIAHDFNNILAVIGNYAEFLREDLAKEDPRLPDVLEIEKAVDRGASLIRQLLAFSRKEVTRPEVLDLNAVIGDIQRILQRILGEDIHLSFKPANELWSCELDHGQMEQVVMNLVVNARDAMENGGRLVIETHNVIVDETMASMHEGMRPGVYVRVDVSDTGSGMDEATKSQIFEPFFTTKERGEGTGLGLATVYGIVKQSGGYISCYSEPGMGTTFRVFMPASDKPVAPPEPVRKADPEPSRGALVMVVEDDPSVRAVVDRILGANGYEIVLASSAAEALGLIEAHGYSIDLLLTDVVMPGGSGKELAQRLRARQPGVRVLYMSGYTGEIVASHGILDDDAELLQKPFSGQQLLERVHDVLVDAG